MDGAVLVTGASTGIGYACAQRLTAAGRAVFAGVRKDEDAERLSAVGATPVMLDVTDAASIAAAAKQVESDLDGRGLAGLVNNAGIGVDGPLEYLPADDWRRQLAEGRTRYAGFVTAMRKTIERQDRVAIPAEKVAAIVDRALFAPLPRTRYLAGMDAQAMGLAARVLPDRARDTLVRWITGSPGR